MTAFQNALANATKVYLADPVSRNANLDGTAIDVSQFEGTALVALDCAAPSAGSSQTMAVKLQHADTEAGSYSDVTGGAFTGITTALSKQVLTINADGLKPWLKIVSTLGGSTPAYTWSATFQGIKKAA